MKLFLSTFLFLTLLGCSSQLTRPARTPDAEARQHIQELISSLPPDSSIRRTLEGEQYAKGIHEPWMDDMSSSGLREAMFEVHGVWRTGSGFRPKSVERIVYRTKYDGPGSQLTDTERISKIHASGLEAKLQEAALAKSRDARWPFESRFSLLGVNCFVDVYLFDDEWIADHWRFTNTPVLAAYDPSETPLFSAAQVGDLLGVSNSLNTLTFSRNELNNALSGAVSYPSDNTNVIRLLIKAGANPDTVRSDGTTLLMESIDYLNESNIRLLVASGADRSRKNRAGDTAFSILNMQVERARKSGRPLPRYVEDLAGLLNPEH